MHNIIEGKAKIKVSKAKKISKQMKVFYNPVMKMNRDVTILLLNSISKNDMQMALPLAGSGVRGVRFLLELKKGKIKSLHINDYSKNAVKLIDKNLKLNKVGLDKVEIHNNEANKFLLDSFGFDYIDVDPFGTPNPFLDAAVRRISRGGILAVTATDTSALSGSSPKACMRKYWAKPLKNEFMHETGIRILIRKVQLIGAEFDKALIPMFAFSHQHYYRVFFRCEKGKQKVDKVLKEHKFLLYNKKTLERKVSDLNYANGFDFAGPLWVGKLWDAKLVDKMLKNCELENKQLFSLISRIKEESELDVVGFYTTPIITKRLKLKQPKKIDVLIKKIKNQGEASRTHFDGQGIRSDVMLKDLF